MDVDIARHSGRSYVAWTEAVAADAADSLRVEAIQLSTRDVIELARETLQDIASR